MAGQAGYGWVWHGRARLGRVRRGRVRQARQVEAGLGSARHGMARQAKARRGRLRVRIVGCDPSLASFGLALLLPPAPPVLDRLRTRYKGHKRLAFLLERVSDATTGADLCVVEGLAFGAKGSAVTDLAGLSWLLRHMLWEHDTPYVVIPSALRCKWLTGRGNASKDECLAAAIKRFPMADIGGNDEADALTLAAMGAEHLGCPLVKMPADRRELLYTNNRKGLPQIAWPERKGTST